jgi:integrase
MAKFVDILTALQIERIVEAGFYRDSDCLYLQVTVGGNGRVSKSWIYRYKLNGRRRHMGLGPVALISLADARRRVLDCRKHVLDGVDPIDIRHAEKAKAIAERTKAFTFEHCARRYLASHKKAWKNAKHAAQWDATLEAYAHPVIGKMSVGDIDTACILKILEPIWSTKSETASRVRGRIEVILDWARVQGFREGDNPARWRGHMDKLLPSRSRLKNVNHHAALPYSEMRDFMAKLRNEKCVAARALEFLILTVARTGEVIGAVPSEIKEDIWTVPGERMKAGKSHRVPLTERAREIAEQCMKDYAETFVFPGGKAGRPLSNMAMLTLLRRMERPDLTAHGFRSTFRDWVSETTNHTSDIAEMALAHTIDNKVEAAYRRGDLFQKRISLMKDWAAYCTGNAPNSDRPKTKTSRRSNNPVHTRRTDHAQSLSARAPNNPPS